MARREPLPPYSRAPASTSTQPPSRAGIGPLQIWSVIVLVAAGAMCVALNVVAVYEKTPAAWHQVADKYTSGYVILTMPLLHSWGYAMLQRGEKWTEVAFSDERLRCFLGFAGGVMMMVVINVLNVLNVLNALR